MPLLGKAALLLSFDIVAHAIAEHDEWHTHEHLPERLSIPGFLRGTRWVALLGQPRYLVLYEVESLAVLASAAYLERLNHPSPWTARMMPHYRGMTRGLCSIEGSSGFGLGHLGLLLRFGPAPGREAVLGAWLGEEVLERVPARPGLGSVHLLHGALAAPSTNEQRIRGTDAGMDWALFATGYSQVALEDLARADLGKDRLAAQGAIDVATAMYRADYALDARELHA